MFVPIFNLKSRQNEKAIIMFKHTTINAYGMLF